MPPSSFQAEPFAVSLTWGAPEGEVEGYRIYRDDQQITTVDGTSTSYTDERVRPGRRYTYTIEAEGEDLVSERARLRVKTPRPSLADARLEGTYDVRLKPTSSYGYAREIEGFCCTGSSSRGVPRAFRGSARARINVTCGETVTFSSVDVRFRVTKAGPVGNEWRVTRFQGTFERSEEAQLGCVASGATYQITGKFLAV